MHARACARTHTHFGDTIATSTINSSAHPFSVSKLDHSLYMSALEPPNDKCRVHAHQELQILMTSARSMDADFVSLPLNWVLNAGSVASCLLLKLQGLIDIQIRGRILVDGHPLCILGREEYSRIFENIRGIFSNIFKFIREYSSDGYLRMFVNILWIFSNIFN